MLGLLPPFGYCEYYYSKPGQISLETLLSVLVDIYPEVGLIYPEVGLMDHITTLIFLWNFHTVFHSKYTVSQFYQHCTRVPISPDPSHLLFLGVFLF